MMKYRKYLPVPLLLLCITTLLAQEITVTAELDTNRALIGDQLKLSLYIMKPADIRIDFPQLKDTITGKIEITGDSYTDTAFVSPGKVRMGRELRITVFDTGFFKIPALRFVAHQGKLMDTINTLPLYFEILPVKADSTIRDIKSNLKAPVNLKEVLYFLWKNYPIIALAIGLCIAVVLIVRYIRRKLRKGRITEREVIQELPEVVALRELEKIRNEKSWLHGRIKVFHIRLSEILRTYIEGHFKVMALELTTDEILRELKSPVCQSSELSKLAGILKLADLVKFAKAIPTEEENALQVNLATEFVQNTSKPGEEITGDTSIEKDSITTALITDNA